MLNKLASKENWKSEDIVPDNALSVSRFLASLRKPIRRRFEGLQFTVYGDVDRVNQWNGHLYVTLVDKENKQNFSLNVFIRKTVLVECGFKIQPKMKLLVSGSVTLARAEIQLIAKSYEDLGYGRLQRQIEEWKEKYIPIFKRPKKELPFICQRIALISNPSIQGYSDFMKHLYYGQVDVYETKMQGDTVAEDIAETIHSINRQSGIDCICIVRGGGSFLDLFEFNKPVLLEAMAESAIPVTTAIGHETDYPLCDAAADVRFSTPTDGARQLTERINLIRKEVLDKSMVIRSSIANHLSSRRILIDKQRETIKLKYNHALDTAMQRVKKCREVTKAMTSIRLETAMKTLKTIRQSLVTRLMGSIQTTDLEIQYRRKEIVKALETANKRDLELKKQRSFKIKAIIIILVLAIIIMLLLMK